MIVVEDQHYFFCTTWCTTYPNSKPLKLCRQWWLSSKPIKCILWQKIEWDLNLCWEILWKTISSLVIKTRLQRQWLQGAVITNCRGKIKMKQHLEHLSVADWWPRCGLQSFPVISHFDIFNFCIIYDESVDALRCIHNRKRHLHAGMRVKTEYGWHKVRGSISVNSNSNVAVLNADVDKYNYFLMKVICGRYLNKWYLFANIKNAYRNQWTVIVYSRGKWWTEI